MGSLSSHHSSGTTKLLAVADSGGGKTGALASLAKAGYNLRILDFDNGLDVLANLLSSDPKALARVSYETCTEKMRTLAGRPQIVSATAFSKAMNKLDKWDEFGAASTWGSDDILVIDSLTHMANAAMNQVLQANNRLNGMVYQSDWGEAQKLIESLLAMLYSDSIKCNVIVNCHITYIGRKETVEVNGKKEEIETDVRAYPMSLGRALSPKIATYFNNTIALKTIGARRTIFTTPQGLVETKTSAPGKVKSSYPIETGLADLFKDIRGSSPSPT